MDLLQSALQDEVVFNYEQMDFGDISSDLPDMMMMSDDDIPDHVDVSDAIWFAQTFPLTLPKNNQYKVIYPKHAMNIIYYQTRCYLDILFTLVEIIMLMVIFRVCICVHITIHLQRNNMAMGPLWYK